MWEVGFQQDKGLSSQPGYGQRQSECCTTCAQEGGFQKCRTQSAHHKKNLSAHCTYHLA